MAGIDYFLSQKQGKELSLRAKILKVVKNRDFEPIFGWNENFLWLFYFIFCAGFTFFC